MTRSQSAGFAQFFPAASQAAVDRATERRKAKAKAYDSTASPLPTIVGAGDASHAQSPSADGLRPPVDENASPYGDVLPTTQGSASSHASTGSSVFSATAPPLVHTSNGTSHPPGTNFTPLTTLDSPSHLNHHAQQKSNMLTASSPDHTESAGPAPLLNGSFATSNADTARIQARDPGPSRKGIKCTYDPILDRSLTKDRKNAKPIFQEFGRDDDDAPPGDPRLDESGGHISYINTDYHLPKARLRQAPYNLRPYPFDPKTSLGPGPPTQILVVGFNPLINFARVSHVFSSFGDVAESSNKMHPETGSYLGFATFRYRDTHIARSKNYGLKATDAARRAVREMHGHKLEAHVVRVEFDPEGKKSRRMLEEILRKEREAAEAEAAAATAHLSTARSVPTGPRVTASGQVVGPPPLAPKGPAAHRQAPFAAPVSAAKPPIQPRQHAAVEEQLVAPLIAGIPYIFVGREFVPVMPSTIPHMKKRLKSYHLDEIRLDRNGYYILFANSPNGRIEAQRCFRCAGGTEFFNYEFNMKLHIPEDNTNNNSNITETPDAPATRTRRTPSPERRRHVEVKAREDRDRRRREEDADLEEEKRQRAKNFDPVVAAVELVRKELIEHLIKHIRTRVAAPALTAHLHPANQVQNRRKAGLEDLPDTYAPDLGDRSPQVGTPNSNTDPIERRTGRLEVSALPRIRKVKGNKRTLQQHHTFADPFARKRPAPRSAFRSLHYRLQSPDSDAESDEEADVRASVARETEEPDSRPRSRMSTDDEFSRDDLASWGPGEDDSMTEASFAASGLPSKKRKFELESLSVAKRQKKAAEELLGLDLAEIEPPLRDQEATPDVEAAGDNERSISRSETPTLSAGKALLKQKSKRKSKKQIFEEREAAKKQLEAEKPRVEEILPEELVEEAVEESVKEEEEVPPPKPAVTTIDFELFSHDVESSLSLPDDFVFGLEGLKGLNMTEVDAPDLARLRKKFGVADLGDVSEWLWHWTEIRRLNAADPDTGRSGGIDGYYVPNSTGCARTEGVKKILNSEKSKYLPHHIKVLKAREAREAKVKKDGKDAVIPTPPAPAKGNSRANRASNRRHVTLLQDELKMSTDPDVFKFNQLKKRKKPVKFARSAIHNWGLYTEENINKDDMIIEYVGEQVRQQISEIREKKYLKQGMGSSYLFRIDENTVIDATKKGGIARFINHSCMPNCTAKIIKVDGSKRIVIYALRDIARNEELTYDYKFEREIGSLDRIPCLCGTALCKGFLN